MREGEREAREQGGRARALRGGKGIRGAERPPGPGLDVPASVSGYTLSESFIRPSPRPPTQALCVWAKRLRPAPAAPQLVITGPGPPAGPYITEAASASGPLLPDRACRPSRTHHDHGQVQVDFTPSSESHE